MQICRMREMAETEKAALRKALAPRLEMSLGTDGSASGATAEIVLRLTARGGPYDGIVYTLRLVPGGPSAMIGRSTGKKFRDNGASLPKDGELSTTHAKISLKAGVGVIVTDANSTNGTILDGVDLKEGESLALKPGASLHIGQTNFAVEYVA
jgi:hypothetical protein